MKGIPMNSLDKKWKEFLYGGCSFGPSLLSVILGAYLTDALNPSGLSEGIDVWSISGFCLVTPAIFGILWMVAKMFDGLVDIPLAHFTDNLRTRWGRRRPAILIAFLPMTISYILAWMPPRPDEANSIVNTVWTAAMLLIYFTAYTLSQITFYGSLSTVCRDEPQRQRVGAFKSFFDTIGYCIAYALVPVFLNMGINIRDLVLYASPLMLTMMVTMFLIKEGDRYGEGKDFMTEARVPLGTSLKTALKNRVFLSWLLPHCCAFFGLQMFLAGQNTLISGVMSLGPGMAAILNTCAFAPVPLMLFIYYRAIRKKGVRFAYRICLACFAVAILNFCVGSEYLFPNSPTTRIIIGCIGSTIGSFAIGAFFATPYMIPSQIAAMEYKITGKDHTAMYFAVQNLAASAVAAVSTGLVYEYVKNITVPKVIDGVAVPGEEWKVGVSLIPVVVTVMCIVGIFACSKMPRFYDEDAVRASLTQALGEEHMTVESAIPVAPIDASPANADATEADAAVLVGVRASSSDADTGEDAS